jgi:hypothetical protein
MDPGNATIFIRPSVKLAPAKSSPKTGTCLEKKSLDLGDVVHRGVQIRPWRGPLPRPKPAPVMVMVLGNFLPKQFVDQLSCADQQLMKETPEADKRRVTNVSCTDVGVSLTQQVLRERAKCFGRSKIDLQQSRLKRLGKKLMLIEPRLAAAKQLQKPSSTAIDHLSGSTLPRTQGPTYAEMAVRPPPQGGDQHAPLPPTHNTEGTICTGGSTEAIAPTDGTRPYARLG